MAEAGADVALWYNSNSSAIEKAKGLSDTHGIEAKAYQMPVTDAKRIESTLDEVVKEFGKVDVFVANAGMAISKSVLEMSLEEYETLRAVNCSCLQMISRAKDDLLSRS